MRRSITMRLVVMFALTALAMFTLVGAVLYGVLERELTRHQNDDLNTNLQNMRYSIERFGDLEHWPRLQTKMDTLTPADASVRFWVLSDDPRFLYGKGLDEMERVNQGEAGHGTLRLPISGRSYRTLSMRIGPYADRPPVRQIVGVDTEPFEHTLRAFLVALTLLTLGVVALVTALGRLEEAYQQLEGFNADVAHELRTPLANLIGGTQVALSRPRSATEFQETLQSNLEELERLRSIVNDMLFLARADQGEAATGLTAADVAHEVEMTIEFFEPLLDETGASVAIEGELRAQATMNLALFRRALSNLLQNAIEHSAAGARLVVTITERAEATWIAVANPGPTIAAPHLPRLFDRFYRVDSSRHDTGEIHGHGLGLAIVKAVASMHGGTTLATSDDGVTTIAFSLAA